MSALAPNFSERVTAVVDERSFREAFLQQEKTIREIEDDDTGEVLSYIQRLLWVEHQAAGEMP